MGKLQLEIKQSKPFTHKEEEVFLNLQRTAETLTWRMTELLREYELTGPQYNVLRILRGAGENGCMCREIAERMVTRDPDMTKLLDRMDARGFITRERDTKDRRVVITRITDDGLALLKQIDVPGRVLIKNVFAHMNPKQLDTLNKLLEQAREQPD